MSFISLCFLAGTRVQLQTCNVMASKVVYYYQRKSNVTYVTMFSFSPLRLLMLWLSVQLPVDNDGEYGAPGHYFPLILRAIYRYRLPNWLGSVCTLSLQLPLFPPPIGNWVKALELNPIWTHLNTIFHSHCWLFILNVTNFSHLSTMQFVIGNKTQ